MPDGSKPDEWVDMAEEYEIDDEDNGELKEFLEKSKGIAIKSLETMFSSIGVDKKYYDYIYGMPVGLDEDSEIPGEYHPGTYGIIIGVNSSELADFYSGKEETKRMPGAGMAEVIAHEIIHSVQTVPIKLHEVDGPDDIYHDTIGRKFKGWHGGFEENMTDALAEIAVGMTIYNKNLQDVAEQYESFLAKENEGIMPGNQMAARLIRKMDPELLKWYVTCAQDNDYEEDRIRKLMGEDGDEFIENMNMLYKYQIDDRKDADTIAIITKRTQELIDKHL